MRGGKPFPPQGQWRGVGMSPTKSSGCGTRGLEGFTPFLDVACCLATLYARVFMYMHKQVVISLLSYVNCQTKAMLM